MFARDLGVRDVRFGGELVRLCVVAALPVVDTVKEKVIWVKTIVLWKGRN